MLKYFQGILCKVPSLFKKDLKKTVSQVHLTITTILSLYFLQYQETETVENGDLMEGAREGEPELSSASLMLQYNIFSVLKEN